MKITLETMVAAGIHLGHSTHHWQPKISTYTYGVRGDTYLIDLVKTSQQLEQAQKFLTKVRRDGKSVLFIGTKRQAVEPIKNRALSTQSFFIRRRWLGGTFTNWSTIKTSLQRLHRFHHKEEERFHTSPMKKESISSLNRLNRSIVGLKGIQTLPGAVIIVGQPTELTAIQECRKLGIPIICRLDTDCNPRLVEIGIPINDDSATSICLFLETLIPRIKKGHHWWMSKKTKEKLKLNYIINENNARIFRN
jgi:small subunit ribosomal protein S2